MGKTYDRLEDKHVAFIRAQKLFFVATAPRDDGGHINVSPKGYDSLRIVNERCVEWVDLGGSGIETQAHLQENGRITLMFCAFDGPANILRVYGNGTAIDFDHPDFADAMAAFPAFDRARAVIRIEVSRVSDSCGWGVPFYEFKGEREQLKRWVDDKPFDEWKARRHASNGKSIDGLPGLFGANEER
jgi:predicted pyridoxine 5'-phosphate oxidase superfamily flavin-nucleotide-binding protein